MVRFKTDPSNPGAGNPWYWGLVRGVQCYVRDIDFNITDRFGKKMGLTLTIEEHRSRAHESRTYEARAHQTRNGKFYSQPGRSRVYSTFERAEQCVLARAVQSIKSCQHRAALREGTKQRRRRRREVSVWHTSTL